MSPFCFAGGRPRRCAPARCLLLAATLSGVLLVPGAQAATTQATGTVGAGSLSNTAPTISPFQVDLSGVTQTVDTSVGSWNVIDATGTNDGYSVTVAASDPVISGSTAASPTAGTGFALELTPATAVAAAGNPATAGPVASSTVTLGSTASTIENAPVGTGQGEWDFPADTGNTKSLAVVIPGDASNGDYSSTLTFTTAPPVAS
jgi:hypothetical protein